MFLDHSDLHGPTDLATGQKQVHARVPRAAQGVNPLATREGAELEGLSKCLNPIGKHTYKDLYS